jgi:uncharacterized protein YbjT (DUF2867 family)
MTKEDGSIILVTGATGTVGSEVVKQLLASSTSGQDIIRAAVHSDNKADKLKHDKRLEIVSIDYYKPETIVDALNNVDKLFLLTPPSVEMVEISYRLVEEARKNHVKFIVKLSAMGADLEPGFTGGRLHRQVEEIIEESKIPYAFLRPNAFMQNFVNRSGQTIKNQNAFYFPAGDGKISFVDVRDVAVVAAEVLTKNGSQHLNKVYDITGPKALSHSQVAEILSEETGKSISYVDISEEDARKGMKKMGMEDWFIQNAVELYNTYRAGYASETTTVVEQITGRESISFAQFAKDYAEAFS